MYIQLGRTIFCFAARCCLFALQRTRFCFAARGWSPLWSRLNLMLTYSCVIHSLLDVPLNAMSIYSRAIYAFSLLLMTDICCKFVLRRTRVRSAARG